MKFTDEEAFLLVSNQIKFVEPKIKASREYFEISAALVDGLNFIDVLIAKIEGIESEKRAKARKQYSRDVTDLFKRLFNPLDNLFNATGTEKRYQFDELSKLEQKQFLDNISAIKGDISIGQFMQDVYLRLMHSDPNGIMFMEYSQENINKCYVTYKGINAIRNYKDNGQKLDWVLFEKEEVKKDNRVVYHWRFVDDVFDRTFEQEGDDLKLLDEKTFKHPFGYVPAMINSFLYDYKKGIRISPIDTIIPIAKEYARDQSFLSIYKPLKGHPTFWKLTTFCLKCSGSGKVDNKTCNSCGGKGDYSSSDVTDTVKVGMPKSGETVPNPIAGYISTDLETWTQYNLELQKLEDNMTDSFLGSHVEKKSNETATGRYIDAQPIINTYNKYANWLEYAEWWLTELVANFTFLSKDKKQSIATIIYGRNYIIDTPDVIYERYEKAKLSGQNNTILDRYLAEIITVKYKNDLKELNEELYKSAIEPYVHITLGDCFNFFGQRESQKKVYFKQWWSDNKEKILLQEKALSRAQFESDFEKNVKPIINNNQINNNQNGNI